MWKTLGETKIPDILLFVAEASKDGQAVHIGTDSLQTGRGALREWQQYQEWTRSRNPIRAGLERQHGYDTKHAMHLIRFDADLEGLEALLEKARSESPLPPESPNADALNQFLIRTRRGRFV